MNTVASDLAVSLPAPALRPYIAHYAGFRATGLAAGTHTGIPSRHAHLIIGLGEGREALIDVVRMPNSKQRPAVFSALVSGLQDAPAVVRHNGTLHGLHVFLKPLGVRAIFRARGDELASSVFHLSDLWGRAAGLLVERLQGADSWLQRFAILDAEFMRALKPFCPQRELAWAWRQLAQTGGSLSIRELAVDTGWSRRHLSGRFHDELGISPKTAARIFRFERACHIIKDERANLAETAFASGYHDQAHMTRDWNALAGCTPKTWIDRELPIVQDYEIAGGDDGGTRSGQ